VPAARTRLGSATGSDFVRQVADRAEEALEIGWCGGGWCGIGGIGRHGFKFVRMVTGVKENEAMRHTVDVWLDLPCFVENNE
jgi:hypothetical protein